MADMAYQISLTLGDHVKDFDIPAIVQDLKDAHPGIGNIDDVSGEAFWSVVRKHDTTAAAAPPAPEPVTLEWLKFSVIKRVVTDPRTLHTDDLHTMAEKLAQKLPNRADYDRLGDDFWAIVHENDRRGRRCRAGECTHGRHNQPCYA